MDFDIITSVILRSRWLLIGALALLVVLRFRRQLLWQRAVREVTLVVSAYLTYFAVRGFTEGDYDRAVENASTVMALERNLGFFWEEALQAPAIESQAMTSALNAIYIWGHWPVICTTAAWLLMTRYDTFRLFRNAFLISGGIGLLIFATFPVAPPRLVPELDVVDTVTEHSNAYRVLQPPAFVNQYAAVPSLHFGWNLLIGVAIFRSAEHHLLRALSFGSPVLMGLAIVLTGNHFIFDAVAGGAVALLGLVAAEQLEVWSARRRENASAGAADKAAIAVRESRMRFIAILLTDTACRRRCRHSDRPDRPGRLPPRSDRPPSTVPARWWSAASDRSARLPECARRRRA